MAIHRPNAIKKAASGAKLVGGLFACTGGLPMFLAMMQERGWDVRIAGIATPLLLFGPGGWYIIGGVFLQRNQYWAIKTTYKVSLAQIVAVVLMMVLTPPLAQSRGRSAMFVIPAMLALYFLP